MGFPGGSVSKEPTCNAGDLGSVPGLGTSPGGGHGNALQCSCLENPMDSGAWALQPVGSQRAGRDPVAQHSTLPLYLPLCCCIALTYRRKIVIVTQFGGKQYCNIVIL